MTEPDDRPAPDVPVDHDDPLDIPIDPDLPPETGPAARGGPWRPDVLAAVALGGALGAPARYEMSRLVHVAKDGFPWATFWTNVSGSFALGLLLVLLLERIPAGRHARPFVATGFLGAYTTFSTFMVESDLLVKHGHAGLAAGYVAASVAAGFLAVWVGLVVGRRVPVGRRLEVTR